MGGRGSSSASGQTKQIRVTRATAGAMGSMAGAGGAVSNQQVDFQMQQQPPQTAPTQQVANQANDSVFAATDSGGFKNLYAGRQYFQKQNMTLSAQLAVMDYIDPNTVPGSLYSASQELNMAMATGKRLTAQQSYMKNSIVGSMHNLGYNLNLYRYDHADFANKLLQASGISKSMDKATQADFNKLVGVKYKENRITSTSYNDFKNAPNNNPFTSRQVKIKYEADANVQGLMTGDTTNSRGQKLSWGEMVLHPDTNYEITGVRVIGNNARKKQSQSYGHRQIEITVRATQ